MADSDPQPPDRPQGAGPNPGERARFDPAEAAAVLARYRLGPVRSVRPLNLGSSRAAKAIVGAEMGEYLLKRRAPGKDTPERVAFAHGLQAHLAGAGFPLAKLVAAADGASVVRLHGHAYELFRFVRGARYDGTIDETREAGATLARFHALSVSYAPPWPPPAGSYHNSAGIVRHLRAIPHRLAGAEVGALVEGLVAVYARAAGSVERLGFSRWPTQVVHNDWHPGNLLFEGGRVAAVLDFDAARVAPRAIDIANSALQFSMTFSLTPPATWPAGVDLGRLRALLGGYDATPGAVISRTELHALPSLMAEALIAEAAPPIAATGTFARLDGREFLLMVSRSTGWIADHAGDIRNLLG